MREDWFADEHEQLQDNVRRKALEWLERACDSEGGAGVGPRRSVSRP